MQSKAANCAFKSEVIPEGSVAVAVSPLTEVAFGAPTTSTGLNLSSAVWPTKSTILRPVSPGTDITIWRLTPLPCAETSDSATPSELTRWRIIATA